MDYTRLENLRNTYPAQTTTDLNNIKTFYSKEEGFVRKYGKDKSNSYIDFKTYPINKINVLDPIIYPYIDFKFIIQFYDKEAGFMEEWTSAPFKKLLLKAQEDGNPYFNKFTVPIIPIDYGELKNAPVLARTIVEAREDRPIKTTDELKEVLVKYLPERVRNKILAQIYQAIRIEVNQEMDVLKEFLEQSLEILNPSGRLSVISYHSLEDRLVKRFMKNGMFEGEPERDFFGNFSVPFKTIGKLIVPDSAEIKINNRARSAKLRIAEKI